MYIPCHMTHGQKVGYTATLNGLENRTHGFSIHTLRAGYYLPPRQGLRTLPTRTFQGDNDTSFFAFADTLRTDVLAVRKGDVDDTPLVWRHSLKRDGPTIVAYLLCHTQRKRAQVLLATLTIIFRVYNDAHAMLGT